MSNLELLEDACAALPHTTRAMFGGHGLFAPNGGMFAGIVTDDRIILKFADDQARAEFVAAGGEAWVWDGGPKPMTMREWICIPDEMYDEPRKLTEWAKRAHALAPPGKAKKTSAKKPAAPAKTPPKTKAPTKRATTKPNTKRARRT